MTATSTRLSMSSSTASSLLIWLTSTAGSSSSNTSIDGDEGSIKSDDSDVYNWSFICVMVFVVAGTVGNVLVCLAVWLERPLQNVTNWFLVSLAFADLIVSTIVMPFGATAGFLGILLYTSIELDIYVGLSCAILSLLLDFPSSRPKMMMGDPPTHPV